MLIVDLIAALSACDGITTGNLTQINGVISFGAMGDSSRPPSPGGPPLHRVEEPEGDPFRVHLELLLDGLSASRGIKWELPGNGTHLLFEGSFCPYMDSHRYWYRRGKGIRLITRTFENYPPIETGNP